MWEIKKTSKGYVIVPREPLYCPFCGHMLVLHDFRCAISPQSSSGGYLFRHVDVHMKCPNCSFFVTFGIPISREDYEKLVSSPLHGRILIHELREIISEKYREIEERIKRWGYW